jgi:hypothetical protein
MGKLFCRLENNNTVAARRQCYFRPDDGKQGPGGGTDVVSYTDIRLHYKDIRSLYGASLYNINNYKHGDDVNL